MATNDVPLDVLATRLAACAAVLEASAENKMINWRLPLIERQFTIEDVLNQGLAYIRRHEISS